LEVTAGGKKSNKQTSTGKIATISLAEKFRRYQNIALERNIVSTSLDNIRPTSTELFLFNNSISELEKKFQFKLDEYEIEKHRCFLKKEVCTVSFKKF
jgi:hypothetical protein